jgi:hypothetical protein
MPKKGIKSVPAIFFFTLWKWGLTVPPLEKGGKGGFEKPRHINIPPLGKGCLLSSSGKGEFITPLWKTGITVPPLEKGGEGGF